MSKVFVIMTESCLQSGDKGVYAQVSIKGVYVPMLKVFVIMTQSCLQSGDKGVCAQVSIKGA